ncbi:MAG: hypothetical protein JXR61_09070 [Prolixibacteraceae bacterium]|nr:hypothetical protein [Prolixibacteraceae bacterium]
MNNLDELIATAIVFYGMYYILSLIADYLLKRRLIKLEQYERVGILDAPRHANAEENKYPSLKWGLVALLAGLGLILIESLRYINPELMDYRESILPFGILLVSISLGFLIYFFIMNGKKK